VAQQGERSLKHPLAKARGSVNVEAVGAVAMAVDKRHAFMAIYEIDLGPYIKYIAPACVRC